MFSSDIKFMLENSLFSNDLRVGFLKLHLSKRYNPFEKDCIVIDRNIKEAKDNLAYLKAERLKGYEMSYETQPESIKELLDLFINYINKEAPQKFRNETPNKKSFFGEQMSEILLPYYILSQEKLFTTKDCRNNIEYKRLVESAEILTQQSAKSEQNFSKESNKEQYIYIGAGALVLLVGVYVILKK
jgi:hypothetical protein